MALREVYACARARNSAEQSRRDLHDWLSRARRRRLDEPFMKLAATLLERSEAVVRGMLDQRSHAIVEAMNGLLLPVKRAARGSANEHELHHHCLAAPFQTHPPAGCSVRTRGLQMNSSRSSRNGLEPTQST